jgi:hypothetical protein
VSQEAAPHTGPLDVFTPFNSPPPSHVWRDWRPLCSPSARTPLRKVVWPPLLPLPRYSLSSSARWRRTPVGDPLASSHAAPPACPCGTSGSASPVQVTVKCAFWPEGGGKDACTYSHCALAHATPTKLTRCTHAHAHLLCFAGGGSIRKRGLRETEVGKGMGGGEGKFFSTHNTLRRASRGARCLGWQGGQGGARGAKGEDDMHVTNTRFSNCRNVRAHTHSHHTHHTHRSSCTTHLAFSSFDASAWWWPAHRQRSRHRPDHGSLPRRPHPQ